MNIYEFIQEKQFSLIVEIGSHFGTDTMKFRQILPNCEIICFEPDPRNLKILYDNGINNIAKIFDYAISNQDGESTFYLSSGKYQGEIEFLRVNDWSASNSLKKPKDHLKVYDWVKFGSEIIVKTIKLDSFDLLKNKIIDFIWADVQGAEDLVFLGAQESLKRTKYIYTEFSNSELYDQQPNLENILKILGPNWEILQVFSNDVLLRNKKLI